MTVRESIDQSPISRQQIIVIGVCFFLNMIDGMDILAISFAAPVIAADWNITPQTLGLVFSAALVGMCLGAIFISPLADKIGRRKITLLSLVIISTGILATAFAQTITQLMLFRFIAGLGIGAILATLTSTVSEFSPNRNRNLSILFLHAGFPIGAMLTGILASMLLPDYGWRMLFSLAGTISLLAIPVVYFYLPESFDFLLSKQPVNALARVNLTLERMGHTALTSLPTLGSDNSKTGGIKALLTPLYRRATITIWTAFVMSYITIYFLLSWVVKLAVSSGLAIEDAIFAGITLNLGAFFGSVTLGYLSNGLGLARLISVFFILGAILTVIYGNIPLPVAGVLILLFVLMYFVQGAFTGLYAVVARLYPTEIRTTGVGWAIGVGRIGAIIGPTAAGLILGAGISINTTFVIFAIPVLIAAILVTKIDRKLLE
ncbi:MAG: AAHS family 4-hydroxybenzoate transporter-like MFS transporter [Gammaproteobacteria bacterium]|jgi:AAHS family 4-hydroxybenzoate transporter-like MFS transporter